ncbi:phenylcoumaran benzylic ether reductase Betv6-like [Euphorbia lathyris]|uniref:phenylcoumaran benzylic ether reductase Betv6-like n=1 Tax=Euphorbia lathyris TaxID=212925 RepID=UPI003313D9BA
MAEKSKILIIGGTGYIGKFIVEASTIAGHPTFALVRESTSSDPVKAKLLDKFTNLGVTLLHGDIFKRESLVKAIKQVDVVISTISAEQLADQANIISAIKEAGNVKRFLPSEFGNDVDHVNAVGPAKFVFGIKAQIRRTIEAEGIPYTYVPSGFFSSYIISFLFPPGDTVSILGDGNVKAILNKEEDIGTYTIRAVDDPRTLNKTLLIKPLKNIITLNEIVALKEKKLGKSLLKMYVSEEQLLKEIEAAPMPYNVGLAINHSVFIKGDQTNFEIDPSKEVEASQLYPDVNYTGVVELL